MTTRQVVKFVKNIRSIYVVFNRWIEQETADELLGVTVKNLGFLNNSNVYGNVGINIGSAVELMNHYNIKLYIGTSFGECQATLNKEDWQHSIDKRRQSGEFGGYWANTPHNKINHISGFGATVGEAVCKCLINCKTAGVL